MDEDQTLFELPPLIIDGIHIPVEKMSQTQLRAFIPLMLKYSTGREKSGWGKESTRPPWWPKELPWANIRRDARSEDEKRKISWTDALRQIVSNCYKFHGREDLLHALRKEDELPPLIIDGIPTPVEKMSQTQLRAFIPLMLKYSTGREKPGWGKESTRPPWWPEELPWANIRMDARSEDEKRKISWTHALRQIVIICYKFHGREDLIEACTKEDEKANAAATANANVSTSVGILKMHSSGMVPTHKIQIQANGSPQIIAASPDGLSGSSTQITTQYTPNQDATVGIQVQVDPNNPIITLPPDGTTAIVQGMATLQCAQGEGGQVHAIQTITEGGAAAGEVVDLNSVTEATLKSEVQIILTTEDGHDITLLDISSSTPQDRSFYTDISENIDSFIRDNLNDTLDKINSILSHHESEEE